MISAPRPSIVPIISAPTMTMKPTPSAVRAPANIRGSAAGRTIWVKISRPGVSIVWAARISTGSTCLTPAITFESITQKQP